MGHHRESTNEPDLTNLIFLCIRAFWLLFSLQKKKIDFESKLRNSRGLIFVNTNSGLGIIFIFIKLCLIFIKNGEAYESYYISRTIKRL